MSIEESVLGEGDSRNVKVVIDEDSRRIVDADRSTMDEKTEEKFFEEIKNVEIDDTKQKKMTKELSDLPWTTNKRTVPVV